METLFFDIFERLPRQGPGDPSSTRRAFQALASLPPNPHILDIGCGAGLQTLELAKLTNGTITALDNHPPFLNKLLERAVQAGVSESITCMCDDMLSLDFEDELFDLIWSEGAIYNIGFAKGLADWKKWLQTGGYLAVTEVSWIKENPPQELLNFWQREYPAITGIETNLKTITSTGYKLIEHFILPENAWWNQFYNPLAQQIQQARQKYDFNAEPNTEAGELLTNLEIEIDMYHKFSNYYGYVFFIMQNTA